MKINRIRQLRAEGKIPVGHMISEFGTRGVAKITEAAGVDFVIIDMEHGAIGIDTVADLVAWFRATPVTPMVRIPDTEYHFIARALDAVGVLFLGQQDLSHSMGIVAEYEHPKFIEALRTITAAAKRHGKAAAAQPMNSRQAKEWIDLGFNVISWGADLAVYELALKAAVEDLRQIEDVG